MKILAELLHKFYTGQVPSKPNKLYSMRYFLSLGLYNVCALCSKSQDNVSHSISKKKSVEARIEQFRGDVVLDDGHGLDI